MREKWNDRESPTNWAPPDMVGDEDDIEPNVEPVGVRRAEQDTQAVDGEAVLNPHPDEKLVQRGNLQG
jgi:hypothetical protein